MNFNLKIFLSAMSQSAKTKMTRVFLVGCPRSGTTLLQAMLSAHRDLYSLKETHIFRSGIGRAGVQLTARFKRLGLLERLAMDAGGCLSMGLYEKLAITFSARAFARKFSAILDSAAFKASCGCWLEKTPEHVFYIPLIEQSIEGARFIHIIRDGRPTVASVVEMWDQYTQGWPAWRLALMAIKDLFYVAAACLKHGFMAAPLPLFRNRRYVRAIELWNDIAVLIRANAMRPGHLVCRYEDLATNPEPILKTICAFLGIDYNPAMLTPKAELTGKLIEKGEIWKKDTLSGLRKPSTAKFDKLSPEIRCLMEKFLISGGNSSEII